MNQPVKEIRQLVGIYAALIFLLAVTAGVSLLPSGWWSSPAALAIASAKVLLIAWFFMRLRLQPGLVRVAALVGLFWLAILIVLTSADYFTRP